MWLSTRSLEYKLEDRRKVGNPRLRWLEDVHILRELRDGGKNVEECASVVEESTDLTVQQSQEES
jgi:hypothetical protein